jgi:hypothetical protein
MRIRFGATDTPECPNCKNHMFLARRVPHPAYGVEFERQTFRCRSCSHEMERNADRRGEILDRRPTIWGCDHSVLYFALKKIEDENARGGMRWTRKPWLTDWHDASGKVVWS